MSVMSNELKRKEMEKKIEESRTQLQALMMQVEIQKAYLKGLEEFYDNSLEDSNLKNNMNFSERNASPALSQPLEILREGSEILKVKEIIQKVGRPMHITKIMESLGINDSKKKISLTGTLNQYSKKKRVFIKAAPNTYGVL